MLLTQMEQISEDVTRKIGPLYFTKRLPLANQIQNLILGYVFDIPNIVSSPLLYNCGLL